MRRTPLFAAACAAIGLAGFAAAQPANDSCNTPSPLGFNVQTPGTTAGTVDNPVLQFSNTFCSSNEMDVWYTFDPEPNTEYRVELLNVVDADGTSSNICVSVMDACNGTDNPSGEIAGNNANDGFPGDVIGFDFTSDATGNPLLVRVGSQGTGHDFELLIHAPPAAPANDLCSAAVVIPGIPFSDFVTDMERATGDPDVASCNTENPEGEMHNAVWWRFEGNDANIRVAFDDIDFSGAYAVLSGSDCNALSEVACANIGAQTIDFFAQSGVTYYFVIMHNALVPITDIDNSATIELSFAPGGPANDACFNAEPLALGVATPGDTTGATGSDPASCGADERDVWYSFTPAPSTTYSFDTLAFQNDVSISVFESFCPFGEDLDIGCASTSALTNSYLYTSDCSGTPVFVRIASDQTEETQFDLTVTVAGTQAPANDRCCAAQPLSVGVPTAGTTVGAMRSQSGVASCGSHTNDVWYVFTPPVGDASYRVTVSDPATSRTSSISAFSGCPESGGTELNCRSANDPVIDFVPFGTSDVYLRVGSGSTSTSTVNFQITVTMEPVPTDCANARPITSVPFTDTWVGIQDAYADEDIMSCGSSTGNFMPHAVWWRYDGDGQRLRVTLDDGTGFTGAFAAFESSGCFGFDEIRCATGGPEVFDVDTVPGRSYFFVVANNSSTPLTDTNNDATIDVQVAPPLPINDECEDAMPLTLNIPSPGTTVAATGFDQALCSSSSVRDVWYSFDPAPSTRYFITISDATSSGALAIFNQCSDFLEQVCLVATDPQVDFTSNSAGDPFLIRFATSETTEATFNVVVEQAPTPPPNDDCASATLVSLGVPVLGTTLGASGTDVATCGDDEWDVWYTFTAANGVKYRATARGLTGAASIAAFTGCEAGELACDTGSASSVAFVEFIGSGAPVFVRVASNTGDTVDFDFIAEAAPAPANDACAAAEPISAGVDVFGSTRFASEDDPAVTSPCGSDEWDVWYVFTPTAGTTYQVRLSDTEGSPSIGLFTSCVVPFSECDTSSPFILQFTSATGDPILLRVASDEGLQQETDFTLRVDPRAPAPANDNCANAISLARGVVAHGTTFGATQDGSASCGADEWDVWYTFTPEPDTNYRAHLSNVATSASLALFEGGCGGTELTGGCDAGSVDLPSVVNFTSDSIGSPITLRVATDEALVEETEFDLIVDFPPPPPANDDCANATLAGLNEVFAGTTVGATQDGTASCGSDELDVWYAFDPEPNTLYRARITDTSGALSLAVFNGCGGTEIDCNTGGSVVPNVDFMSDAAGTPIVARVASDEGSFEEIDFVFTVNLATVPANDLCVNATVVDLSNGPFLDFQDTISATDDGDSFSCVTSNPNGNKSIWYSVTPVSTLELVATITPVFYNPNVVVYTGTCGNWTEVACDATGGNGAVDSVTWTANAGVTYLVSVSEDGTLARGGLTDISIRSTCPCEYDGDAGVDVFDLLSYLDLWFPQDPGAETDGTAGINVFDLLEYLDCWFPASAGNACP